MIPLLGMACVAWTAYEILRLVELGRRAGLGTEGPRTTAHASRSRGRRFAAWDDRGRPIHVEDLGRA